MLNRRTIVGRLAVTSLALWAAQAGGGVRVPLRSFKANDFGAKGDGITLDTQSIQAAIDAAAAAGGTVCFARGVYLTGSLFVKSGVTIALDKDVCLRGSNDLAHYPLVRTRVAGIEMIWPAGLLNVYREKDVRIDGDGKVFWDSYWNLRREYDPRRPRWAADYDCRRPRLVHIFESAGVTLRGLQLTRSGFWSVHVCYSHDVHIIEVTIRNNEGGRGPSTDGIDIDSSRDVVVERADITCNDDALCIKAGRDSDGLRSTSYRAGNHTQLHRARRRCRHHVRQRNFRGLPQDRRVRNPGVGSDPDRDSIQVGSYARRPSPWHLVWDTDSAGRIENADARSPQRLRTFSNSSSSSLTCLTICWLWLTSVRASSPVSFCRAPPMVKPCS